MQWNGGDAGMSDAPLPPAKADARAAHASTTAGYARPNASLRALVNRLEGGFLILLLVTAAIGALWAAFWQDASSQAIRINAMLTGAQTLRADVYRGVKEVTRAQLQRDADALDKYWRLLYRIDFSFNGLQQQALDEGETQALAAMRAAYARMQTAMNRVFADSVGQSADDQNRAEQLDPAYERWILGDFEAAFRQLNQAVAARRVALESRVARFNRLAPLLISLPIAAGVVLLLVTRRRFRRQFVLPMESVRSAATHMRSGDLDKRLDVQGVQELRDLSLTLNEMARDLSRSRDALVAKERQAALGALVPVVAHNIRNPLASIRAAVQVVEVGDEQEWPQVRREIISTVDRLGRWVSSLLSYLNPLQPHPIACPAVTLLEGAAATCRARAAERSVALRLVASQAPPDLADAADTSPGAATITLEVDVDLMEQALHGLISNAIEASPRDGEVLLQVARTAHDLQGAQAAPAPGVQIVIRDDGPGIPPQIEPEELRPGPTTKRRGTGLGIPFAFKVIRGHGGTLHFDRPASGGTRAVITLPTTLAGDQASPYRDDAQTAAPEGAQ